MQVEIAQYFGDKKSPTHYQVLKKHRSDKYDVNIDTKQVIASQRKRGDNCRPYPRLSHSDVINW
jgi:hypothetical protein